MKKSFILLFCIISLIAVTLTSCKSHQHTFSDKWYSDKDNHWHPATCDHSETERGEFGPHIDDDENSICDVCADKYEHTHTHESNWTSTDFYHWKGATCSHSDEKKDYGAHSDEDLNGVCDVCESHVHNVDESGFCTYCGEKVNEIDETRLDKLVEAVLAHKYLVNGGSMDYIFEGRSNSGSDFVASKNDHIDYTFGKNNFTYINAKFNTVNAGVTGSSSLESWHHLVSENSVFGVTSVNGGAVNLDLPEQAKLNGYHIDISTLAGEYGVEETLYALYEAAIADGEEKIKLSSDSSKNKMTFSYNKIIVGDPLNVSVEGGADIVVYNANYYEVQVTFTYTDDYALTSLETVVDCYTSDPGTAEEVGFLYDDVDIQYDSKNDSIIFVEYDHEKKEYIESDRRTPDTYTVKVTQTVGERTKENPYPKSNFIPDTFELYFGYDSQTGSYSDKFDGSTVETNVRETTRLYVGNCLPLGTSLHFVADKISVKAYWNGVEVDNPEDLANQTVVARTSFSGSQRTFFVIPKKDGAYRIEIYLMDNKIHEINIRVGVVDEEYVELEENQFTVKVTEKYSWTNAVLFTAPESGIYYFNVPTDIGFIDADAYDAAMKTPETDDGPKPYIDYYDDEYVDSEVHSFCLVLEAGQTVRFYVNGIKRGTYVITYNTI